MIIKLAFITYIVFMVKVSMTTYHLHVKARLRVRWWLVLSCRDLIGEGDENKTGRQKDAACQIHTGSITVVVGFEKMHLADFSYKIYLAEHILFYSPKPANLEEISSQ